LLFGSEQEIAARAEELGVNVTALLPLQAPPNRSIPAGGMPAVATGTRCDRSVDRIQVCEAFGRRQQWPALHRGASLETAESS
jgi:hypothetical protein